MDISPLASFQNVALDQRMLATNEKNKVYPISVRLSEVVKRIAHLPICEVRELPDWTRPLHIVNDSEIQKCLLTFHRYGPARPISEKKCPFQAGDVREKFVWLTGENNLATTYEENSEWYRAAIISYFTYDKRAVLKQKFKEITHHWIQQQLNQGTVHLFNATSQLVGKCLIKGMLGYDECSEKDVRLNTEFWKELLQPTPSQLQPLSEMEEAGPPSFFQNMGDFFQNGTEMIYKLWQVSSNLADIHSLCEKIFYHTVHKEGSLANHLKKLNFSPQVILENIQGFLLAGQETVAYTLGFLLYEYAKNPSMQAKHAVEKQKIKNAYLETLRMYSVAGAMRSAGLDMVITYLDPKTQQRNEHYIRKGDLIVCESYFLGHNPLIWQEPEVFNPERPHLDAVRKAPHFGHGPHRCPGERTAEMELITIVEEILQHAHLNTKDALPELVASFTQKPLHDISISFQPK